MHCTRIRRQLVRTRPALAQHLPPEPPTTACSILLLKTVTPPLTRRDTAVSSISQGTEISFLQAVSNSRFSVQVGSVTCFHVTSVCMANCDPALVTNREKKHCLLAAPC